MAGLRVGFGIATAALMLAGCGGATTATPTPASAGTPTATATANAPTQATATPPATPTATATATATPTPAGPIFQQTGSGGTTTAPFQAPSTWTLNWTYDCAAFGSQGNFQVYVFQGSSLDFSDNGPNQLGASGTGSTHFYSGGNLHLEINSECDWTVAVVAG